LSGMAPVGRAGGHRQSVHAAGSVVLLDQKYLRWGAGSAIKTHGRPRWYLQRLNVNQTNVEQAHPTYGTPLDAGQHSGRPGDQSALPCGALPGRLTYSLTTPVKT
jgi:hypothetical protein